MTPSSCGRGDGALARGVLYPDMSPESSNSAARQRRDGRRVEGEGEGGGRWQRR